MKFIDLFAGIGGFRLGMESAGHECVAFCEIDKFARASYKAIHNTEGETEYHDITSVTDEQWLQFRGTVDVICGGFPCQAFSVAGKRQGFLDETRGTLFFEIARSAKQIKPRFLFLENVKGLLSHDKGRTFGVILNTLDELGYDCEWQVLNSKNFGVPQNRERVFIIGHLRETSGREVFPIIGESGQNTKNSIKEIGRINPQRHSSASNSILDTNGISPCLDTMKGGSRTPKIITGQPIKDVCKRQVNYKLSDTVGTLLASQYKNGDTQPKVVIPVLTPDRAEKRQNGRRFKSDGDEMFTLTAQDRHGVLVKEATKKGYSVANVGDSVNISHPNSKTRRGRVGKQIANTLLTGEEQAVIVQKGRGFNKGGEHDSAPTLSANSWQENNLLKVYDFYNKSFRKNRTIGTLTANGGGSLTHCGTFGISDGIRIRKLTPRECWRLQGFPDWAFDKAQEVNSNSQLYKQAGNSVTVNVISAIATRLEAT